jgi:hypothetical protein
MMRFDASIVIPFTSLATDQLFFSSFSSQIPMSKTLGDDVRNSLLQADAAKMS